MEPTTGIEPVNLILTKDVLYLLSYVGTDCIRCLPERNSRNTKKFLMVTAFRYKYNISAVGHSPEQQTGAGNGIRTRDPQLGRLTL